MKRRLKILITIIMVLLLPTGCAKMEAEMSIRKDKSVDYTLLSALDKSIFDQLSNMGDDSEEDQSIHFLNDEDKREYQKAGISIEDYEDDDYIGAKAKVSFISIDDISSPGPTSCSLDLTQKKVSSIYCFEKQKGYFYDTYIAKINTKDLINSMNSSADATTDDSTITTNSIDLSDSINLPSIDAKFTVNLPYENVKTNATKILDDGKKLEWDLNDDKVKNSEYFEFTFRYPNTFNYYFVVISIIVLSVLFILVIISNIVSRIEKKKEEEKYKREEPKKEEVIEEPKEVNPKINALLSEDGNDINNFENK